MVPFLHRFGSGALFLAVAAVMVVIALDVAALGPTTNGQPLERMNESLVAEPFSSGGV